MTQVLADWAKGDWVSAAAPTHSAEQPRVPKFFGVRFFYMRLLTP